MGVTLLPFPGLGAIVELEIGSDSNKNAYRVTMGQFSTCTCPDFVNMAVSAIGGRQQYVNCKHSYYLYRYFCKMDVHRYPCMVFIIGNDTFVRIGGPSIESPDLLTALRTL